MHQTVRFILAGKTEEVTDCEPTTTILEFLRENKGLKGTKEGCAEGDCGACTVVIGELCGDDLVYRSVNSCIQFLPSLDGKQLLTVEDLSASDKDTPNQLHDVQQAMLEQHGSQCGFCTPGFVMSLFAMYHNTPEYRAERTEIDLGLAGNLCRCTGYAPIVRAAEQSLKAHRKDRFMEDKGWTIKQLKSIQPKEALELSNSNGRYFAPRSIEQLFDLLQDHPQAVMVAGATDVGLWVTKQNRRLDTIIYLGSVEELKRIESHENSLHIGATVTYTDATPALTAIYPGFLPLLERLGASQVRNAGTIGGNIANGSPIGDMPPALIAIGARLKLQSKQGQRIIDLEDYFISYGKQDLKAGECVVEIILPVPRDDQLFATYKVSKRFEQDISSVCGAFSLRLKNDVIDNARICFGGMAATPKRALNCENTLKGKLWNRKSVDDAMQAMLEDYTPLTDMRASASYRMRVAQNLLLRFFLEQTTEDYPVRLGIKYVPVHFEENDSKASGND